MKTILIKTDHIIDIGRQTQILYENRNDGTGITSNSLVYCYDCPIDNYALNTGEREGCPYKLDNGRPDFVNHLIDGKVISAITLGCSTYGSSPNVPIIKRYSWFELGIYKERHPSSIYIKRMEAKW